jgi:hypothetical protein
VTKIILFALPCLRQMSSSLQSEEQNSSTERETLTTVTRSTFHRHYAAKLAKDTGTIGFVTTAITNAGQFSTAGGNYLRSVSKASTFLVNTSHVTGV